MKQFLFFTLYLICFTAFSQTEFHVFTDGKATGNGSLQNPWDLQTALSQKPDVVNGGDTIWIHEGVYTGRFVSTLQSNRDHNWITVAPYKMADVILNGNVESQGHAVLHVKGKQVIFRDFEVTWLGDFSRDQSDPNFRACAGIYHTTGEDCKFYNLKIHDNPGLGFGSWKHTGGTIIENCMIYHNGFIAKTGKGAGEGMYVQNTSEKTRMIRNNIIFSNYYKGIEVWSAGRNADFEYVKNITIEDNVIFNSGSPSGAFRDNVIVATDDRNGVNIAKNIQVLNNIFYHNTDYMNNQVNGDAPSLTIGYVDNTPVEDIVVKDNIILGRNNALRLLHVKSMTLSNNTIYGGYVFLNANEMHYSKDWKFNKNTYYTKKQVAYRVDRDKNYALKDWQTTFNLDKDSQWNHIKQFDLDAVLRITENSQIPNRFKVVLFDKKGKDVSVDFSKFNVLKGSAYKIYDAENSKVIAASGIVTQDRNVVFPMNLTDFESPINNALAQKTLSNFGVYIIEFEAKKTTEANDSTISRIFDWLGL